MKERELSIHGKIFLALELAKDAGVGCEFTHTESIELLGHIRALNETIGLDKLRIAELEAYADKLAQGLPEGMLPKDVEILREQNWKMTERIAELEAELNKTKVGLSLAVEAMVRRWIPVSERLPERLRHCQLLSDDNRQFIGQYDWSSDGTNYFIVFETPGKIFHMNNVTHWQKLPEPPEVE